MPAPAPASLGRILGDAIAGSCVAALVIPFVAMVFARWHPVYGIVATWVAVIADVGWGVALFVSGLRRIRRESEPDVRPKRPQVPAETHRDRREVADDR